MLLDVNLCFWKIIKQGEYKPPSLPFELPTFDHLRLPELGVKQPAEELQVQFGKPFKEQHFLLEVLCALLHFSSQKSK
jgi:hypothetical protein